MNSAKEPQSYGSQKDWVEGNTNQEVNSQKGKADPKHTDRDTRAGSEAGGFVSPVQAAASVEAGGIATGGENPVKKVSANRGGSKSNGYFKNRDY